MTTENDSNDGQTAKDGDKQKPTTTEQESGDPGRTPGSAEGDEETIDEDIREKEAEGKL